MSEKQFLKLCLKKGQIVLIHPLSGSAFSGAYAGNFDGNKLEFDLDNYASGEYERIALIKVSSIVI